MMDERANRAVDEEEALDLLVDDELDEAQRRELLTQFDRQPDGWRRCALAFLEAQSWKREMRGMVREPAPRPQPAAERPVAAPVRRRWTHGRMGTVLAVAASFFLALGLGTLLRDVVPRLGSGGPGGSIAGNPQPGGAPQAVPGPGGEDWRMVNLGVRNRPDGTVESVQLPACERDSMDPAWMDQFPRAMPEQVRRALERTGHEVEQSRQYVPVRMRDGRQLVVPVDQVDVHYVGNQPYQ